MAFCACGGRVELELTIKERRFDPHAVQNTTKLECCGKCSRRITAAALRAADVAKRKPAQQTFFEQPEPVRAPRSQSLGEAWFELFAAARLKTLEDLHARETELQLERPPNAAINTLTKRWIESFGGDQDKAADWLGSYVAHFLRNTWAAGLSPPFPWTALASEKIWRPHLDQFLADHAEHH